MAKTRMKKVGEKKRLKGVASSLAPADLLEKQEVKITAAKGRPMLTWVGKRPLQHVTAFPAQHVETFDPIGDAKRGGEICNDWPERSLRGGLLFHGDNKEVLAHLLANGFRGRVKLIYIDPPFDSGADYVRKVSLRGVKGTAKLDGEGYTLGEQLQYTDIWANDNYLQFMYERLLLLKELLTPDGSLFVHLDSSRGHYVKLVLDEVFGQDNFRNEIIVKRRITKNLQQQFEQGIKDYPQAHDVILWYCMETSRRFTPVQTKQTRREEGYWHHFWSGEDRPTMRYELLGVMPTHGQWKWSRERAERAVENYRRFLTEGNGRTLEEFWEDTDSELEFIRKNDKTGKIENWFPPRDTRIANTLWMDIHAYENQKEYPTEKHENLLHRITSFASGPGDTVLDCFIGSGTTAVVAQRLGRRWIGCDINKGAIQTTSKRLQTIIQEQIEQSRKAQQVSLAGVREKEQALEPVQLSFAVYRVNDYDLTIHHEEAVQLACEHIGITRIRTDPYFDGTFGKKLVKVIPFNHPLTLLDLEELKRELEARSAEDRPIVLVCLGKEPAADAWIEDWNRLRKGSAAVNRIEVIELRADPKYGKFFQHQPARACVKATRKNDTIVVAIEDFISPSIIERLQEQGGILKPKIDDWRAMVDCVLIDPDYDGQAFRIGLSDVPERKTDLVAGRYEIPAGRRGGTIAVKVIDMLGEEVLVTLPKK